MHGPSKARFGTGRARSPWSRRCEPLERRDCPSTLSPAATPAAANAAFVQAVYQDILGRQAGPTDLGLVTTVLNAGLRRDVFAQQVVESPEANADFIGATYEHYLGRSADPAGLACWVGLMQAGESNEQIEAAFLASEEFYRRAGSMQGWIESAYQTVLGRPAEAQAVTWATTELRAGASLRELAVALISSPESSTDIVERDLSQLEIPLDANAVAVFTVELSAGRITDQQLQIAYLGSAQYFDVHTGVPVTAVPVRNGAALVQPTIATIGANAARGNANVVFVGDSITQFWTTTGASAWNQYFAPLRSLDAGVKGDTTENVLWRLDNGNLDGIAPRLAVLMVGVNDLSDGASDIAAGVTAVVDKLQSEFPGIRVLLFGILPALQPAAGSPDREEIAAANELIKPLGDGQHVWFLDVGSAFLNRDGSMNTDLYQPDEIHPNAEGYDVLAQAIAPWVQALS